MTTTTAPVAPATQSSKQLQSVLDVMKDGKFRTLAAIRVMLTNALTSVSPTTQSISARLRDLRKEKFGGYLVEKKSVEGGLFEYRVDVHSKNPVTATQTEMVKLRVVTVTNNVIRYPQHAEASLEFANLVGYIGNAVEITTFVVDPRPEGGFWAADEFFSCVDADEFFVDMLKLK